MAFRASLRVAAYSSRARFYSQAAAVPTSSLGGAARDGVQIERDAKLPNPDPAADSASAALVGEHAPFMVATYSRPPPVFVKGEGPYLWDVENRRYLDLTAGIAVNSLGHCDAEFSKLIAQQVSHNTHGDSLFNMTDDKVGEGESGQDARARLQPLLQPVDGRALQTAGREDAGVGRHARRRRRLRLQLGLRG